MKEAARPALTALVLTACMEAVGRAHGPLGIEKLDWSSSQISEVVAGGYPIPHPGHVSIIEGRNCLVGNMLNVNVRDKLAFDIDETVDLALEFYLPASPMKVSIVYDRNGSTYDANAVNKIVFSEPDLLQQIVPRGGPVS